MKNFTLKMALVALLALGYAGTALSAQALADKGGHGKGHERFENDDDDGDRHGDHEDRSRRDDLGTIIIGSHDRNIIRDYLAQDFHRKCPPGLAKKHNGCLPPGQAKKYHVGERLPKGVGYSNLPQSLMDLLSPPPQGYQYVKIDKDVALMSEAGKKIIDAVTLMSAVQK